MDKLGKFHLFIIFVSSGILSGVASLALSSFLPEDFSASRTLLTITVLVLIEELSKFLMLFGVFRSYRLFSIFKFSNFLIFGALLGFGFGLFEFFVILLSSSSFVLAMLKPMLVHILTCFGYGAALFVFAKIRSLFATLLLISLSVLLHLWYNAVVIAKFL